MKNQSRTPKLELVNIQNHSYIIDNTESYHQQLVNEKYEKILNFYENNAYINHAFCSSKILSLSEEQYIKLAEKECEKIRLRCTYIDSYLEKEKLNAKILELGCGCGSFLNYLYKKSFSNISGLEISPLSKNLSRKLWKISFRIDICEVISRLKSLQASESYEIIFAFDFIEHILNPTYLIKLIFLNLKPGGKLFVEIPIIPKGINPLVLEKYEFLYPDRHIYLYTKEGINNLIESQGFTLIFERLTRDNNKLLSIYEKKLEKDNKRFK